MKLTPEQREAYLAAVASLPDSAAVQEMARGLFLAGCLYQERRTLERAAKACDEQGEIAHIARFCAEAIRALSYETEE